MSRLRVCQFDGCRREYELAVGVSRRDTEQRRYQRYCSRDCYHAARRNPPTAPRSCSKCGVCLDQPRVRLCPECRAPATRPKVHTACQCGAPIVGTAAKRFCAKCQKKKARIAQIRSGGRAAQRVARKLRQRQVAVEAVNPIKVMERDGWRCQLCGTGTPKRLRGTGHDHAPELDHIIPLACGGEHSYRNVQCACRKCNLSKSAQPKGQLLLFG